MLANNKIFEITREKIRLHRVRDMNLIRIMNRAKIVVIVGVFLGTVLGLVAAPKWIQRTAPFAAFETYLGALAAAKTPQAVLPYLAEDARARHLQASGSAALSELETLRSEAMAIEVLYYETRLRGALGILTLEGIDHKHKSPATWTVYMVDEPGGWKFRSLTSQIQRDPIQEKVRTWIVGKDRLQVEAILKSQNEKDVVLLLDDMRPLTVPLKELSDADLVYLAEYAQGIEQKLQWVRNELLDKSKSVGLIFPRS